MEVKRNRIGGVLIILIFVNYGFYLYFTVILGSHEISDQTKSNFKENTDRQVKNTTNNIVTRCSLYCLMTSFVISYFMFMYIFCSFYSMLNL